ncbi:M23 family metallopeptidase [Kovacikia minuta CCNUW1]|uniref:M23 family metallopeptidase n=1 Tax=Kovacikia minuta TaxID=2931930 RepID=UPI001CCB2445|nr:M23 family metallopeptidase [Kovacikia minuta CCNUW1]
MKKTIAAFLLGLLLAAAPNLAQALPSTIATPDPIDPYPTFVYPVHGVLTSGYGWRWGRLHKGIDIAAPTGTPIVASAEGTVNHSGWNDGGYGLLVKIKHLNGSTTLYAHNNRILVQEGDFVEQGQIIAFVGSTGRSTGPHCHFEIRLPGKGAVNPIFYMGEQPNNKL